MKRPSITTCCPRFFALEHSDCQTGTVVLKAPTPKPVMNRPITNCASPKLLHSSTSPMKVKIAARRTVFRRPRISPIEAHAKLPNKAPSVQVATTVPLQTRSAGSQIPYHRKDDPYLNSTIRLLLRSSRVERINLRESLDPTLNREQSSNTRLIVPKQNERRQRHQQRLHQLQLFSTATGRHLAEIGDLSSPSENKTLAKRNKRKQCTLRL